MEVCVFLGVKCMREVGEMVCGLWMDCSKVFFTGEGINYADTGLFRVKLERWFAELLRGPVFRASIR